MIIYFSNLKKNECKVISGSKRRTRLISPSFPKSFSLSLSLSLSLFRGNGNEAITKILLLNENRSQTRQESSFVARNSRRTDPGSLASNVLSHMTLRETTWRYFIGSVFTIWRPFISLSIHGNRRVLPFKMTRVFIGRLAMNARESDVEKFLQGYGKVRDISLKRGYGFVVRTMKTHGLRNINLHA